MSLIEAVLRRQREEREGARLWLVPEPEERPKVKRSFQGAINGKRIKCFCGECKTCRNREWMRARRGGLLTRAVCASCGKRAPHDRNSLWCSRCQTSKPAQFRIHAAALYSHGGGI